MKTIPESKKEEFIAAHLPHRLTLLRTFKKRQEWFESEMRKPSCRQHGDLARCAKDSALISIRLLSGALALRALEDPPKSGSFRILDHWQRSVREKRRPDDIWIDDLGGSLPTTDDLTDSEKRLLVGVLKRADKELAHLTEAYNDEFNTAKRIIDAIDLIERLLDQHLYQKVGRPMPHIDCGIDWNRYFFAGAP